MLNFRLARPGTLIAIHHPPELRAVEESAEAVTLGACITHAMIADGRTPDVGRRILARVAEGIAYRAVRNRGTIGGSLAHADPAADWPAVLLALDASVVVAGARGERTMKIDQLIAGPLTTALGPGEILTRTAGAYEKLPNPASRFAIVGVAAEVSLDARGAVQWSRIALTGLAPKVTRAAAVEQALTGKSDPAAVKSAAAHAADGIEVRADLTGSAAYKAQLAAVYTERAVLRAMSRARER
jgi:carbon-monoxide dehydrogenase medium subunit